MDLCSCIWFLPHLYHSGAAATGTYLVMPAMICQWWAKYSHHLAQFFWFQCRIEPLVYSHYWPTTLGSHKILPGLLQIQQKALIDEETAIGHVKTAMGSGAPYKGGDSHNLCLERRVNLKKSFSKYFLLISAKVLTLSHSVLNRSWLPVGRMCHMQVIFASLNFKALY